MDRIVKILRESPCLTGHRYKHQPYSSSATVPVNPHTTSYSGLRLRPFTYLLIGGSSLEILKEIMEMAPPSDGFDYKEKMPDGHTYEIVHTACLHRSHDTELIRHFASMQTYHLSSIYGSNVSMPIHIALSKYAPVETIRVLLDLRPSTLTETDYSSRLDCLNRALWHQYFADKSVVDLFVNRFKARAISDFIFRNVQALVTEEIAETLLDLLLECRSFSCIPGRWEVGAWTNLLRNIPEDAKPEIMELELPLDLPINEIDRASQALSNFLSSRRNLSSLILSNENCVRGRNENAAKLVRSIANGLGSKNSLQILIIANVILSHDTNFANLLVASPNLRKLFINCGDFTGVSWRPPVSNMGSCAIEELSFNHGKMAPDFMRELLLLLADLPHLKELKIHLTIGCWKQLMKPLAKLIRCNKLKKLCLGEYSAGAKGKSIDQSTIFEALKGNTSLQSMSIARFRQRPEDMKLLCNILLHHNTSIRGVDVSYGMSLEVDRIKYFLRLNGSGRGEVRSAEITLSRFVSLIGRLCHRFSYEKRPGNLCYGLLRECPGLWCDVQKCRKRKRM